MILGQQTCFESQKQGTNSGCCVLQADQSDMFHLSSRKLPNELARVGYLAQKTWMVIICYYVFYSRKEEWIGIFWPFLTNRFQVDIWKHLETAAPSDLLKPNGSSVNRAAATWLGATCRFTKEKERMSMVIKVPKHAVSTGRYWKGCEKSWRFFWVRIRW